MGKSLKSETKEYSVSFDEQENFNSINQIYQNAVMAKDNILALRALELFFKQQHQIKKQSKAMIEAYRSMTKDELEELLKVINEEAAKQVDS